MSEVNLVLDIGNGSVGAALVVFARGAKPRMVFTHRAPLSIPIQPDSKHLSAVMLSALESAVSHVAEQGPHVLHSLGIKNEKVRHTFCILASPWYASKTKIVHIENKDPIFITKGFVRELLDKEEGLFEENLLVHSEGVFSKGDFKVIEKKVIHTTLNGYSTSSPYEKRAEHIELAIHLSVAPTSVVDAIERIVGKFFYAKHMLIHSFPLVGQSVVSDLAPSETNFLFVDVSAEVTDVSFVENHVLMETASFPMGRNHLVREIAKAFDVTTDIAMSFASLHAHDNAERAVAQKIDATYAEAHTVWGNYFSGVVSDMIRERVPAKIFVTADEELAPVFVSCIKKNLAPMAQGTINLQGTPVVLLDTQALCALVDTDAHTAHDPFLAIESIFFSKLFNEQ